MRRKVVFEIPASEWLTANGRRHWADKARRTRALRTRAYWIGRAVLRGGAPWTPDRPCRVRVTVRMPTGRRFDPPNAAPTVKALIDGLTDAGWWPDDDAATVREVAYRGGEKTGRTGVYRLAFDIEDLEEKQSED